MGKTRAVHKLQNTLWERNTTTRIHRGNDLLSSSSPHAAVTVEATTSLSLSLSVSIHTRYTITYKKRINNVLCPKSYLYIYDFRVIYTCVPSNRSDGSEPGLRSSGSPYLSIRRDLFSQHPCHKLQILEPSISPLDRRLLSYIVFLS